MRPEVTSWDCKKYKKKRERNDFVYKFIDAHALMFTMTLQSWRGSLQWPWPDTPASLAPATIILSTTMYFRLSKQPHFLSFYFLPTLSRSLASHGAHIFRALYRSSPSLSLRSSWLVFITENHVRPLRLARVRPGLVSCLDETTH